MSSQTDPHQFDTAGLVAYVLINYFGLFVTVGIGWLLWRAGTALLSHGFGSHTLDEEAVLFGLAAALAGVCLVLAGLVGTAHKLLVETRSAVTE